MQNVCLVTTQSFNEGSLDARTLKRSLSHQLDITCFSRPISISHQLEKNLLLNESLTTPNKHTVKVVKGNEMVGHLPRKFSQTVWYFLARSGEISVKVIDRGRCRRMEVPCQLAFNFSNSCEDSNKELI